MIRRSLLVLSLLAALFSAQADPMYYTFEGVSNDAFFGITYLFVIDFDAPALLDGLNYYDNSGALYTRDYGSVVMDATSESLYFPVVDATEYQTAMALRFYDGFDNTYENTIDLKREISSPHSFNYLTLTNTLNSNFEIGDFFTATDYSSIISGSDETIQESTGLMQLTSKSPNGSTSVSEPGTLVMLSGSLIFLSGLGMRRRKSI